jgi:beta propeller repeat protein
MRVQRTLIFVLLLVCIVVSSLAIAPVCTQSSDQRNSEVSGSVVVWEDERNGNWDIYMKNMTSGVETRVSSSTTDETNPDIDGNRIVYQFGSGDILLYDIGTGATSTIVAASGVQSHPRISGNRVVWQDRRSGTWDVYMKNLDTSAVTVLTSTGDQYAPAIDGAHVVWMADTDGGFASVIAYDTTSSTSTVISSLSHPSDPDVGDGIVTFLDWDIHGDHRVFYSTVSGSTLQTVDIGGDADGGQRTSDGRIAYGADGVGIDLHVFEVLSAHDQQITANVDPDVSNSAPAIDGARVVWETNLNGNWDIYTEVLVIPRPDLGAWTFAPPSGTVSRTFTIQNSVKNYGTAPAGPFTVGFYLSPDTAFTTADVLIGTRSIAGLDIGEAAPNVNTPVTIPSSVPEGSYYLGMIIDPENVIAESNEANNVFFDLDPITIAEPDLRPWTFNPPRGVTPRSFVIQNSVKNNGTGTAGPFVVGFYLSTDIAFSRLDVQIGTRSIAGLAPGAVSTTVNTTARVPDSVPAGTYYVVMVVDQGDDVNESNEANNVRFDLDQITIAGSSLIPVPGCSAPPGDLNGDGTCEDVNGNGRKDFADVTLYFNQMTWIAANEPLAAFDFNGNGRIDFADVTWLFNNL